MISSSAPSSRGNNLISCQRVTNSCISSLVWRGQTCETQLLFCSALRTVTFFLLTFKKRLGAIFFGAVPLIQLECQKLVLSPLPTVTIVEALKRSLSMLSQGMSSLAQGQTLVLSLEHSVDLVTFVLFAYVLWCSTQTETYQCVLCCLGIQDTLVHLKKGFVHLKKGSAF